MHLGENAVAASPCDFPELSEKEVFIIQILHLFDGFSLVPYCILLFTPNPADNYLFKVNNKNTRTRHEICSKLTIKTPVVNFEHISHLVLVFL